MKKLRLGRASGFTLIEVLVVVSIIFLLAVILFPVFARAREQARRSRCSSNLRQIGLALRMYIEDFDDRLPTYIINSTLPPPGDRTPSGSWYWSEILYSYHRNPQVFYCPSGVKNLNSLGGQYGANTQIIRSQAITMSAIGYPATTYIFMDAGLFSMDPTYYSVAGQLVSLRYIPGMGDDIGPAPASVPSLTQLYYRDYSHGRHFGGVNMCFMDGHVKWLRPAKIIAEAKKPAPRQYGAWGRSNAP